MLICNDPVTFDDITYPMYSSPKLDGIRCLVINGELLSRNGKPIRNKELYSDFEKILAFSVAKHVVFDCEIYSHDLSFQEHQSIIMSYDAPTKGMFDLHCITHMDLEDWNNYAPPCFNNIALTWLVHKLVPIPQVFVETPEEAAVLHQQYLRAGYEGSILRNPKLGYKHGRTTRLENWAYKFKELIEYTGVITECIPMSRLKPGVARTENAFGNLERTYRAEDYETVPILGAFRVKLPSGVECNIGTWKGLTQVVRIKLWEERDSMIGKTIKFTGQHCGIKDVPRTPRDLKFL
jgi:DNA ligase-1